MAGTVFHIEKVLPLLEESTLPGDPRPKEIFSRYSVDFSRNR